MVEDKVVVAAEEVEKGNNLRAESWDEFVGQEKLRQSLDIAIKAAKNRKEPLEHILFYGPPGLGKTTLAHLVAKSMGVSIRVTSGPAIERAADLASILSNLQEGDVLFIDEIHRLNKTVEETLYPAMEDYVLDVILGKGPTARSLRLELAKFTLIGATTRVGLLAAPLRDRFGVIHRLSFYDDEELKNIVANAANKLEFKLDDQGCLEVAKRSRRTARVALKLLRRVRDYVEVHGVKQADREMVLKALKLLEVDELGLDEIDRKLLKAVIEKHGGGPVGVETLAALINEDVMTIKDVYEPFLMQIGLLKRTSRGRMVTEESYRHLGMKIKRVK
ncbi:Holliday junction branch migration DNA helicase RuvB [Candidatus Chazhemtobacterium aquaticus]|uniref:Holliday junction branch migration complex subunit RuvB n=1 Tax=Candidatus Chazhemtobacterium aquaticus TaxID=2715735 RepID=A0A857N6I0_9BACT|nr:Holliday junction branch migration DNA helicase RuvB [Candidatus Chazhemtobacterium aquaticus]QHO63614.1 Holliday junction ATP-dependent DNA helicase RuvB [Candidatus Chazhemtobacterium aquaticus]